MAQSSISERLLNYFTNKSIKVAQVSRQTGIQYDSLQQILSGKVKAMGVDKFTAIWRAYPDMDAWHILTGEPVSTERQVDNLTTIEELRSFKNKIDQVIEQRITELEG